MQEVSSINKLKKIYSQYPGYQELIESDQVFYDQIFNLLWIDEEISHSNKTIGQHFGYATSTIEKKLRRIEASGLIIREVQSRYFDYETQQWLTIRKIYLAPAIKSLLVSNLNILPKTLQKMAREEALKVVGDQILEEKEKKALTGEISTNVEFVEDEIIIKKRRR